MKIGYHMLGRAKDRYITKIYIRFVIERRQGFLRIQNNQQLPLTSHEFLHVEVQYSPNLHRSLMVGVFLECDSCKIHPSQCQMNENEFFLIFLILKTVLSFLSKEKKLNWISI